MFALPLPLTLAAALFVQEPPAPFWPALPPGATATEAEAFYLLRTLPLTSTYSAAMAGDDASARLSAVAKVREAEAAGLAAAEAGLSEDDPRRDPVLNALRTRVNARIGQLAGQYESAGDWDAAEKALTEAVPLTAALHGLEDYRTGDARRRVEDLRTRRNLTERQRAELAQTVQLNVEVYQLWQADRPAEAIARAQQILAIRRRILGDRHRQTHESLINVAAQHYGVGEHAAAQELFAEALVVSRAVWGTRHPNTASTLTSLASALQVNGDYAAARVYFKEALEIRREVFGPSRPETAYSLNNLAIVLREIGDYAAARPLYEEALAVRREALGPSHLLTAVSLNDFAVMLREIGDYDAARPLYEEALAIRRKALGERHAATAVTLNNLAALLYHVGDYAAARPLYEEALEIQREISGPHDLKTATCLNNLAALCRKTEDDASARTLYEEALEILRRTRGPEDPATATTLSNYAVLLQDGGDYAKARTVQEEALAIRRKAFGRRHPDTVLSLSLSASISGDLGEREVAGDQSAEAVGTTFELLDGTASGQGAGEQRRYAATLRSVFDHRLSLTVHAPDAAGDALAWKGQVLARRLALSRVPDTPELSAAKTDLQRVSGELSSFSFNPPDDGAQRAAWRTTLDELAETRGRLERTLSRASAEYRLAADVTPADLAAALPAGTAVVDVHAYEHRTPAPDRVEGRPPYERRLTAFLHRPGVEPVRVDLGAETELAALVDLWRAWPEADPTRTPPERLAELRREAGAAGEQLRGRVWEPLEPHLGEATTVLVSPDGPLCRLPLAALPGRAPGTYLIEEVAIAAIPVPRLLPLMLSERAGALNGGTLLAVGGVDYDAAGGPADPAAPRLAGEADEAPGEPVASRSVPRGAFGRFLPLVGTGPESAAAAQSARAIGFAADTLSGAAATEAEVRRLAPTANVLHLATHGYFAPPTLRSLLAPRELGADPATGLTLRERDVTGYAPGLLSGLAFAGANRATPPTPAGRPADATADGLLTAEEVGSLDLSDCRLAVLSACETGLGETAGGEGLLGLQRSFQAAGAATVVASQWQVPDGPTAALMEKFYAGLWGDQKPTLAALREAQLWILNNPDAAGVAPADRLARGIRYDGGPVDDGPANPDPAARPPERSAPRAWAAWSLSGDWR